ncbi:2-aminoethylphosphonate--pyruvate transaminase [Marinobacter daepoensis]|uniref:2-aminoethylphosphonate--pyruvate transaminase n=1 Tax=Marinobacter daepoensis TaxID=262077 RepID=A0ABS3BDY2_9GAMM|nr:2-aminoethylphosphonate--pyruvate transaminase [Marinobacter daepoensis]MBN7769796.1 2-aminoethylphosphonate--pyruvate transaminase [Marinobacter daepoensis]MBY6078486.1 2-aminoethylphosphonate--pyruvate transaminase [Marinobacter daepoensis]
MTQKDPYLLTPGPLTTSLSVKEAMLHDWGSWDGEFNRLTGEVCERLLRVAGGEGSHVCVPMQGSGTFAVEATLGTLIPPASTTLVLMNGAYGQRIGKILDTLGRPYLAINKGDYHPPRGEDVARVLADKPEIEQVVVVHCETSSGILNPIEEIADVCREAGKRLIIDSMSAFGAVPVNVAELPCAALVSSANKCFEGVPGFGFAIVERELLAASAGQCHSLSLDLHAQWQYMEKTGQWRFTPPTHVVAAFLQAMCEHEAEGGVAGRLARYRRNRDRLVAGLREIGFQTLLADEWLSPIITTFLSPDSPNFEFSRFYDAIKARGFLIYPGKLTVADSFRVGCIGQLHDEQIDAVVSAISDACQELGLSVPVPAPAAAPDNLEHA